MESIFSIEEFKHIIEAFLILILGLFCVHFLNIILLKILNNKLNLHSKVLITKFLKYSLNFVIIFLFLERLGVDLKVLLGAAGILSVAIGFASQTSASNLISGIFLLTERPFAINDTITIGDTTGVVVSIDLFSTRLRTMDNLMVRIPNENLMKSQIINMTHFPIRRFDLKIKVSHGADLEKVASVLRQTADKEPGVLNEPEPLFITEEIGDSGIHLQFSMWVRRENFLKIKNKMTNEIVKIFKEEKISIPYPHRVIIFNKDQSPDDMISPSLN